VAASVSVRPTAGSLGIATVMVLPVRDSRRCSRNYQHRLSRMQHSPCQFRVRYSRRKRPAGVSRPSAPVPGSGGAVRFDCQHDESSEQSNNEDDQKRAPPGRETTQTREAERTGHPEVDPAPVGGCRRLGLGERWLRRLRLGEKPDFEVRGGGSGPGNGTELTSGCRGRRRPPLR
jgi:hypothetical protein